MQNLTFSEIRRGTCGICKAENALVAMFLTGNKRPPWKLEVCLNDLEKTKDKKWSQYNLNEIMKAIRAIEAAFTHSETDPEVRFKKVYSEEKENK